MQRITVFWALVLVVVVVSDGMWILELEEVGVEGVEWDGEREVGRDGGADGEVLRGRLDMFVWFIGGWFVRV